MRRTEAAATALLLALTACSGGPPPPPRRVAILGIDGATWRAIDPLVARELLPTFEALRRSAAWGELASLPPYNSPQMWTSIATGQPPAVHGIENFTAKGPDGKPIPASSNLRKVPAAWNIVSDLGASVGVVGWYVTWPAERVNGFVVSDHVRPAEESAVFWPVSSEEEAVLTRRTHPDELLAAIAPSFVGPEDVDRPEMRDDLAVFGLNHPYLNDETFMRVGLDLHRRHAPDLMLLYQHGTDVMQHLGFGPFEAYLAGDAAHERPARRIIDYYRYQDDNLRRLVESMGGRVDGTAGSARVVLPPRSLLGVVSDHGFGPGTRPTQPIIQGDHLPEGILILAGDDVAPGRRLEGATVLDVLPTVLHVMGLPVSAELPGRVLTEAFVGPLETASARREAPYPFHAAGGPAQPSPLDDKILDQLRALGYIQ